MTSLVLATLIGVLGCPGPKEAAIAEAPPEPVVAPSDQAVPSGAWFDDTRYAELLDRHTRVGAIGGVEVTAVDYAALSAQAGDPDSLYRKVLADFSAVNPAALPDDEARKAFWMNAYNIGAIKMLVDHWPVESITSRKINILGSPWKKEIIEIGGELRSLDEIEHGILLGEMRELRTHWAIVCASVSCPSLRREPFRAGTLDAQLAAQARGFFNEPRKGARVDRKENKLWVTKIYKFDQKNFDTLGGGIGK
ncbi:MAG: DUF547 domain-containing protein, partial [Deltaproteobacteria bacterium]|nr:DUF547 domain-containing protein [Deltaproteobacteria bacterium]